MLRTAGEEIYDQWVAHEIPFDDPAVVDGARGGRQLPQEPGVHERWAGRRHLDRRDRVPGGRPAHPDGTASCTARRPSTRPTGRRASRSPRTATSSPSTCRVRPPRRSPCWVVVSSSPPSPTARGAGVPDLPGQRRVRQRQGPGHRPGMGQRQQGPGAGEPQVSDRPALVRDAADESAVFRFDGSDLMPGAVGAGSFWKEMTNWIANDKDDAAVLSAIETSWPRDRVMADGGACSDEGPTVRRPKALTRPAPAPL